MNESMTQNTQEQVPLLPNMSARVYPVNDPKQEKGCILANASVDLGGCFAVTTTSRSSRARLSAASSFCADADVMANSAANNVINIFAFM